MWSRPGLLVMMAACGTAGADAPRDAAKVDPCSATALKLGKATQLPGLALDASCKPASGDRAVLATQAELDKRAGCPKSARPTVDLAKQSVLVVPWNMSPAATGLLAFDDGKTITLVTRFRSPCPNDPRPMPMQATGWYTMPAGGTARAFTEATCTTQTKCP